MNRAVLATAGLSAIVVAVPACIHLAHAQAVVQAAPDDTALKALQAQMAALASRQDNDAATAASAVQMATSAQTTANAAATPAQVSNAVAAATPADCPAPLSDALVATAGTTTRCMPKQDAQRATQVQRVSTTTNANGMFTSVPWKTDWSVAPTTAFAQANTGGAPVTCQVATWDTHSFSGQCWQSIPATIPGVVVGASATVSSTYQNAAAGIKISVIGGQ